MKQVAIFISIHQSLKIIMYYRTRMKEELMVGARNDVEEEYK